MIANCPACGTHYKHDRLAIPARGRCGRCDASIDLSRLRPYRVLPVRAPLREEAARAASHSPIGLDDPFLATTIARNVDRRSAVFAPAPVRPLAKPAEPTRLETWEGDDPLPPIPEMTTRGMFESSVAPETESDILAERARGTRDVSAHEHQPPEGRVTTFVLWLIAGTIIGTGASWTFGGETSTGVAAGAFAGALIGWGWVRWTSPK